MNIAGLQRSLLWIGAAGTAVLIAVGTAKVFASGPLPLPLFFAISFVAAWMLSPYWGAFDQQRQAAETPLEALIGLAASMLVVALGAYAYLTGWVFYRGPTRMTGQGMLALIIPLLQWVILATASGLRWLNR